MSTDNPDTDNPEKYNSYTKEQMIEQAIMVGGEDHRPSSREFDAHSETVSTSTVERHFGTYNNLMEAAGYEPSDGSYSRQELADMIDRWVKENGFVPTMSQIGVCDYMAAPSTFQKNFEGIDEVVREAGHDPEKLRSDGDVDYGEVDDIEQDESTEKADAVDESDEDNDPDPNAIRASIKRVGGYGHRPTKEEYMEHEDSFSISEVLNVFVSWSNACVEADYEEPSESTEYTREELLDPLTRYIKTYDRIPKSGEVEYIDYLPSLSTYKRRFGSMEEAASVAGFILDDDGYVADQTVSHNGVSPVEQDVSVDASDGEQSHVSLEVSEAKDQGSASLEEVDSWTGKRTKHTKEEAIDLLERCIVENDGIPPQSRIDEDIDYMPSCSHYYKRFGDFAVVIEKGIGVELKDNDEQRHELKDGELEKLEMPERFAGDSDSDNDLGEYRYSFTEGNIEEKRRAKNRMLNDLRKIGGENKPPKVNDFHQHPETGSKNRVYDLFGDWNNFCTSVGYREEDVGVSITRAHLIDKLRMFVEKHGKKPTDSDFRSTDFIPGRSSYNRRFGTIDNALIEAGYPYLAECEMIPEDSVEGPVVDPAEQDYTEQDQTEIDPSSVDVYGSVEIDIERQKSESERDAKVVGYVSPKDDPEEEQIELDPDSADADESTEIETEQHQTESDVEYLVPLGVEESSEDEQIEIDPDGVDVDGSTEIETGQDQAESATENEFEYVAPLHVGDPLEEPSEELTEASTDEEQSDGEEQQKDDSGTLSRLGRYVTGKLFQ